MLTSGAVRMALHDPRLCDIMQSHEGHLGLLPAGLALLISASFNNKHAVISHLH